MAFEIKYIFHDRDEKGQYNTEKSQEKIVKLGKLLEDIPLEKVASSIMSYLARRDIWVTKVEVFEIVKKEVNFKESKDGRGIVLKGKKFSFVEGSKFDIEETEEIEEESSNHLIETQKQNLISIKPTNIKENINNNKVLYRVLFDPPIQYFNEVKRLGLRFSQDKEYPVHKVVQHPTGKLELQKIAVTDDAGRVAIVDEKFFTIIGSGLLADRELNFSGSSSRIQKKPKLAFEDQMISETPEIRQKSCSTNIPLDDGSIPEHLMSVPDIRAKRN
jgi:hypothetical protein